MSLLISLSGKAQYMTYNHDADKMHQFTVGEIGVGTLSPDYYYWLLHNSYRQSAASRNKLLYRTEAGAASYMQVEMADSIRVAMEKRAEIEALNIADRSGGALDLAWAIEGNKITSKLESYKKNIDRILGVGGNLDNQSRWNDHYRMFSCAIKATQDAYMPNAERKKQYLAIYADICRDNEQLVEYLVRLNNANRTSGLLNQQLVRSNPAARAATAALNRWREAGWKAAGSRIVLDNPELYEPAELETTDSHAQEHIK